MTVGAPLTQTFLAAGVVGGIAAIGVVAALLSSPATARSHPAPLTRVETKPCSVTFCSWEDVAPPPPTAGASINMPGSLVLWAFSDCTGCMQLARGSATPAGFAFGYNGHPVGGNGHGASTEAHGPNGAAGSNAGEGFADGVPGGNQSGGPSNGGLSGAPGLVGGSGTGPIQVAAVTIASVTTTPEPATFALFATGLAVLVPVIRRKHRR